MDVALILGVTIEKTNFNQIGFLGMLPALSMKLERFGQAWFWEYSIDLEKEKKKQLKFRFPKGKPWLDVLASGLHPREKM